MSLSEDDQALSILSDLIAFDTTSREPNRDLIEYVRDYLGQFGIKSDLIWNPEETKANLWATIGPDGIPGTILSGHTDVVPVDGQDWNSNPFSLHRNGDRLHGRGTADMKGFIAIVLSLAPEMVKRKLKRPIHFAFSYDEEVGCAGVLHLIDRLQSLPVKPSLCVIGEPTELRPIIGHKGGRAYKVRLRGLEAHSSLAPRAVNAIEYAAELIVFLKGVAEEMRIGASDDHYDIVHSTLQTGLVHGGTAINIVPKDCELTFEFRHLIGIDPDEIVAKVKSFIDAELLPRMRAIHDGCDVTMERLYSYPALDTSADDPAVRLVKALVGRNDDGKVAFGTEGGIFSQRLGIPTVVCGPGSIQQAHKPDEFVTIEQIQRCTAFISRLIDWSESESSPIAG